MNKKILEQIVKDVRATPDSEFDMNHWKKANCQTTGCAVGNHVIKKKGECKLKLKFDHLETDNDGHIIKVFTTKFGKLMNFDAVAAYCDIEYEDAEFLFGPASYNIAPITKKAVIDRITKFIKGSAGHKYLGETEYVAQQLLSNAENELKAARARINKIKLSRAGKQYYSE